MEPGNGAGPIPGASPPSRRASWGRRLRSPYAQDLALVLLFVAGVLAVIAIPRSSVSLTNTRIDASARVPPAADRTVTVTFVVRNAGGGGTDVIVQLNADGAPLASSTYSVPGHYQVAGNLAASAGCAPQSFSLQWCYPPVSTYRPIATEC